MRRRFRLTDDGIDVSLPDDERDILATLLSQFRELLMIDDDPNLTRLKPVAHPDDPEASREYTELVGDQLLRQRLEAIEAVEGGLEGATLDDEGIAAWLQTINGLRLVLGERLDVTEDLDVDQRDPEAPAYALYEWLGWLLEQLVRAAADDLPPGEDQRR
jgi:hypothetical protein